MSAQAVLCHYCGCAGRSDEMKHFDITEPAGEPCAGHVCEPCQEMERRVIQDSWERFQTLIGKWTERGEQKPITFAE